MINKISIYIYLPVKDNMYLLDVSPALNIVTLAHNVVTLKNLSAMDLNVVVSASGGKA